MTSLSPPISLFNFTIGNTCRTPFTLVYEKLNNSLRETTPWEKKQGSLPLSNSPPLCSATTNPWWTWDKSGRVCHQLPNLRRFSTQHPVLL